MTQGARDLGPSVLGPTIVMKGDLSVGEDLIIRGEVHGRVVGTDTVVIKKSARVSGRISAAKIEFEQGVRLDGVILSGTIARRPRER
jgi:cytoskeletal protein CcmA (bactofilin family)